MKLRLVCLLLGCVMLHAAEVRVTEKGHLEAEGGDMRVFRGEAATPLFGNVTHEAGVVSFAPAVPLVQGEAYRVDVQAANGAWNTQRLQFEPPKVEAPAVSIAPSPLVLPANALKLYLHFTQPMEQGVFLERITLHRQDESESAVPGAFRETELWSPDGKRLTLWLHPGRQKAGVNLNLDEGPVLREGERYTLKIARTWRSVAGVPMGREVFFTLNAGPADHTCPDPRRWQITVPKTGTRDGLRVVFDEPLDPAMLKSALVVRQGEMKVAGEVQAAADACSWSFVPAADWPGGGYALEINPLLEDLAGNSLQHPFEVDREEKAPQKPAVTRLPFELN